MTDIAIVGAGISGLHLALRLQQAGVSTTVYADRGPEDIAAGPPANLAVRFGHTVARERDLGVAHWDTPDLGHVLGLRLAAQTEPGLGFFGHLGEPASAVDFRVYLPHLIGDYLDRGGQLEIVPLDTAAIERMAARHDLVVVSAGRQLVTDLFPRDDARSPFTAPPRRLCVGLFHGIAPSEPSHVHFQLCPGAGEIFCTRLLTFGGLVHGLNIETIPGGPLEPVSHLAYGDDPAAFDRAVLDLLAEYAPPLRERIDERAFGLARPVDLLQGPITPVVRQGWAALPDGGHALALGDAWVLNDPVTGQGANLGSRCAAALAEEIIATAPPYDEDFCRRAADQLWRLAEPVVGWTNAALGPPDPHVLDIMASATADGRVADAFADNFNDPDAMWEILRSADATAAWLHALGR